MIKAPPKPNIQLCLSRVETRYAKNNLIGEEKRKRSYRDVVLATAFVI